MDCEVLVLNPSLVSEIMREFWQLKTFSAVWVTTEDINQDKVYRKWNCAVLSYSYWYCCVSHLYFSSLQNLGRKALFICHRSRDTAKPITDQFIGSFGGKRTHAWANYKAAYWTTLLTALENFTHLKIRTQTRKHFKAEILSTCYHTW